MTSVMPEAPPPYRVYAHNTSTASENRIHHDDVAAQYGFRGGLVPGVAVYAYMTRPAVDGFGRDWVERGTMAARFRQPLYEGDEVLVTPTRTAGGLDLEASRGDGDVCATGNASLPPPAPPPDPDAYPVVPVPAPEARPPANEATLAALPGLSVPATTFRADKAATYLDGIRDDHGLFRQDGLAHPGWLIRFANTALAANVRLGPWIHTGSDVRHFRGVVEGDRVSARARVADLFERKGHRFVVLDVVVLAGDEPALHALHTAIYDIARRA